MDNDGLTQEQKDTALDRLGVDKDKAKYYAIANDETNLKTLYVLDSLQKATSQEDVFKTLVSQRLQVNGKMIATNTVLDNLVDEGIISKAQATELKKYKYEDGVVKPIKKTAPKARKVAIKKVTVSRPSVPKVKLKRAISKIKTKQYTKPKFRALKPIDVKRLAIKRA